MIHESDCGRRGTDTSSSPASAGVRPPFLVLQRRHAATTFVQECSPPCERGTTWSRFSACRPQYWHRWPSRWNTVLRFTGIRRSRGTRTYRFRRTTDGDGIAMTSDLQSAPFVTSTSARSRRTSTRARLTGTTESGSRLAFRTSDRDTPESYQRRQVRPPYAKPLSDGS